MILQKLFGGRLCRKHYFFGNLIILGIGALIMLFYLNELLFFAFTLLTLPITVRRLHDIGLSGCWAPIGWGSYLGRWGMLIAIIFNLFVLLKKGRPDINDYGFPPTKDTKFFDALLNRN